MANHPRQVKGTSHYQTGSSKKNILETEKEVSWLHEIFKGKRTAEELIPLLINEIEVKPQYYRLVSEICKHLDRVLRFFYQNPIVKIVPFGSCDTRLAMRGSDFDVFLDFGENLPEPPDQLLLTLKNKVRKYRYFVKARPIFARIPILQCVHCSGVSCDISFLNAIGVANSNLIKFLLSLDDRLKPLMLIVKFLIKKEGLLKSNAITSYAVVILIIYFLQTITNPIIPPISLLQKLANKPEIVADWDMSFSTETSQLPKINNDLCVIELLKKFFEFYATFEFGFYVISSFTAKVYLKPIFFEPNLLPEEFYLYKKNLTKGETFKFDCNKCMCIQNPFNHCNNITRNVTQKYLIQFQQFCENSAAKGREIWNENDFEEKKKFLKHLLEKNVEEPVSKKIKKIEPVVIFVGQNLIFDNSKYDETDLRNKWFEFVFCSVKDILIKVMKCNIDVHTTTKDSQSSSCENVEILINCDLPYHQLITKRRNEVKCEFQFPQNMTLINQEEVISNYLCDTVLKDAEKVSLKFEIICSIKKGPTRFCMHLNFTGQEKCSNFHLMQQVFQFIKKNFPKWIK